jgi:hypothetical protein
MRLVSRGDLDGLTRTVVVTDNEKIDEILLIHPQDITDGKAGIYGTDILADVPYHPACARWFDRHLQTENNPRPPARSEGAYALAPSAAGLVYQYYGCAAKMPQVQELARETDRLDSRMVIAAAMAHSILDRACTTSVGALLSRYGGGGHRGAGTVTLPLERADDAVAEIIGTLKYEAEALATSAPAAEASPAAVRVRHSSGPPQLASAAEVPPEPSPRLQVRLFRPRGAWIGGNRRTTR